MDQLGQQDIKTEGNSVQDFIGNPLEKFYHGRFHSAAYPQPCGNKVRGSDHLYMAGICLPLYKNEEDGHVDGVPLSRAPAELIRGSGDAPDHDIYFDVTSGFDRYTNYEPVLRAMRMTTT